MNLFKKKYKRSEWFAGLLECEQHVYEGYNTATLYNVATEKFNRNQISEKCLFGIEDYIWYYENILQRG